MSEKKLPPGFDWDPESISAFLIRETWAYPSKESQQKCADEVIEAAWERYDEITLEIRMERDAAILERDAARFERDTALGLINKINVTFRDVLHYAEEHVGCDLGSNAPRCDEVCERARELLASVFNCRVNPFSSRMCSKGTVSCTVDHEDDKPDSEPFHGYSEDHD